MTDAALRNRWFDASGGLAYHARAWRYRERLWRPFTAQVGEWLRDWRPPCDTLVLVGPSAGYALDAGFVHSFTHCVMIEPDPLARWLLRRRFPGVDWHEDPIDVFANGGPTMLQRRFPAAAILFCNVVGQAMDATDTTRWCRSQSSALRAHHWASWHDVFSSSAPPSHLPAPEDTALAQDAEIAAARAWTGQGCRVADHGTFGWLPEARYALWQLAPGQWHVIGWVTHAAEAATDGA